MDNSFDESVTPKPETHESEPSSMAQSALDIRKLDALATETWLLIILAIVFGGLCIFKFWGLSWFIFVPTAIILVVAMVKLWDVKTANELKNRAAKGDTQAQHRLEQRKQQRQQLKEKVAQISNQAVTKARIMMSPDNLRGSNKPESTDSNDEWRLE
ncbi:MAG: hypothetical protein ACRC46_04235 [Thermoguttaceae bacterium]